jgi:hypothetical protein
METAVVRKYARWCGGTAVRTASYPISPACNAGSMFPPQFSNHVVVEYLQEIFFVKFNAMFVEQVYILLSERFCFMMLLLIFYIFN